MGARALIYNKLITDFSALQFEGGNTIFNNVKKFYADNSMDSSDCLIIPDQNIENVTGLSAGNTATTRQYGFLAMALELIEASADDAEGSNRYDRLANTEDAILDYLQKEPSNLNSWGQTNSLEIFKTRVSDVRYDIQRDKGGYAAFLVVRFTVFLNVIPQNL